MVRTRRRQARHAGRMDGWMDGWYFQLGSLGAVLISCCILLLHLLYVGAQMHQRANVRPRG